MHAWSALGTVVPARPQQETAGRFPPSAAGCFLVLTGSLYAATENVLEVPEPAFDHGWPWFADGVRVARAVAI